ncbi:non-specific serine/threonine protein kinase [Ranunculus cassubicifolius]
MERAKPIRFSSEQLKITPDNFTHLLGSGGFGAVYQGVFSNGVPVAVKILNGSSDKKKIEEQFMAEVSTIGGTHHCNLVRLYGFCFDRNLRALVYEYMVNGSLDRFLFQEKNSIKLEKLHGIACEQMIVHYNIKSGNILLDANFNPKIAEFAKLCNRNNTHISNAGLRGTPGYAAPELWMPFPVTCKCDVYSFGMLLFEIIGRRRNVDVNLTESQEWFPKWVWNKFEKGETVDFIVICGVEEKDIEMTDRTVMVALWCVQYRPESRPCMSLVVKMLEGGVDIQNPINPFPHLVMGSPTSLISSCTGSGLGSNGTQVNGYQLLLQWLQDLLIQMRPLS